MDFKYKVNSPYDASNYGLNKNSSLYRPITNDIYNIDNAKKANVTNDVNNGFGAPKGIQYNGPFKAPYINQFDKETMSNPYQMTRPEDKPVDPVKRPGLIKNLFGWTDARGTHYNPTWQSYAPLLNHAFNLGEAIFKKPDFSPLDEIDYDAMFAYANGLMQQPPHINATMEYKPIDKNYYLNRNNSQYGALMNNARQTSGGNAAANFAQSLMADRQMQNSNADIMRQAEEMNWDRYKTAKEFNKDVEQQNAANALHWMQQIVPLQTQKFEATKFKVQKKLEMLDEWRKQRLTSQQGIANYLKEIGDRNREFNTNATDELWMSPNGATNTSNIKPSRNADKYTGAFEKLNPIKGFQQALKELDDAGIKDPNDRSVFLNYLLGTINKTK